MEKRVLLAVILSLLVLYLFQAYFTPPEGPVPEDLGKGKVEESSSEAISSTSGEKASPINAATDVAPLIPEKEIRVETALYSAVFITRRAALKSWVLKRYLDQLGVNGKPIEMVSNKNIGELPFSLALLWKEKTDSLDIQFQPNREALDLTKGEDKGEIIFTGKTSDGVLVKKTYIFSSQSYVVDINVEVTPPSFLSPKGATINWIKKLDHEKDGSSRFGFVGPAAFLDGRLTEVKLKTLDEGPKAFSSRLSWVGYEDKYFLAAFFPQNGVFISANIVKTDKDSIFINCFQKGNSSRLGETNIYSFGFYCGPKDIEILHSLGKDLEKAINFGMFDIIAKPLLYILKYFNKMTHNYGLAIILLTVLLKVIFFPLTHKSYKSMKVTKDLQPQVLTLKKKYKDDKEQLNREILNLYRTYKVNPLGGCLPLLLQFPIFIAFYWVLLGSIELRHAPFMLWIKDLSAYDPYYVTPILMGASMFIQQKMTPTAADPTQAKVMLATPIIFTFLFLKFPSGLVIYWLVNNILQIFQQLYIDKRIS